jgi:hypothetical protein
MKKLALIGIAGILVVLVIATFLVIYQPMPPRSSRPYEILKSAQRAVENLESLEADAYFFQATETDSIKESSRYSMQIEFLRNEGMAITITSYGYECSDERSEVMDSDGDGLPDAQEVILGTNPTIWTNTDTDVAPYKRLEQLLKNAWILDKSDKFYVYTPMIFEEYVTEFRPQPSLLRYRYDFIPLADLLHLAERFDHAENATYEGIETINVENDNSKVEAYSVSYEFSSPTTKFAEKAKLRTWISTEDYIPVKTELHATNETTGAAMHFVFGFDSYEKDVFIPEENLTLPENLKILPRH